MRASVAVVAVVLSVVTAQYFQNPVTTRGWFSSTGPCGGGGYEFENKPNFYFYEGDTKTIQYYLYQLSTPSTFDLSLHKYGSDTVEEVLPPTQYGWQIDEYRVLTAGTISALKASDNYPLYPDSRNYLGTIDYNAPDNGALNPTTSYVGHRAWGLYVAAQTGAHRFYISGDDVAELYMSTTAYASSSRRICYAVNSGYQVYTTTSSQKSGAVNLIAGETYYMEVLHAQSEADNYFSVMVEYPDATQGTIYGYYSLNGPSGLYKIVKTSYLYNDDPLDTETTGSHLVEVTMPSGSKCDFCALGYSYADQYYACTDVVVFSHDDDYEVTFKIDASTGSVLLPSTFRSRFLDIFTEDMGYYADENVWFPEEEFTVSGDSYAATVRLGNSIEYTAHDLALYTVRYDDLSGLGVTVLDVTYGEAAAFGLVPSVFTAIVAVAGLMWQLL